MVARLYTFIALLGGFTIVMAIFSNFLNITHKDNIKNIKEINDEIIFFETLMGRHEGYVKDMLNSVVFQKEFQKETSHTNCDLGKWYYDFIKSKEFKELSEKLQKDLLDMEDDHEILHKTGLIIKNDFIFLDRNLKKDIMNLRLAHYKLSTSIKDSIEKKWVIDRGLNYDECQFGKWWKEHSKSESYKHLLKTNFPKLMDEFLPLHQEMHEYVKQIHNLQKEGNYKEASKIYSHDFLPSTIELEGKFGLLVEELEKIEGYNNAIITMLSHNIPTSIDAIKHGLKGYQEYLQEKKDLAIIETDESSKTIDLLLLILGGVNILILIGTAYWVQNSLIGNIKYLRARYKELQDTQTQLIQAEKMASLGGMVAGVAHEINTPVGMALTGITHLKDETKTLKKLYENEEMGEEDFKDFIAHSEELSRSILVNLEKAASLVRSFKQVAVDQSSEADRDFKLKEYIEEILSSLHSQIKKSKVNVKVDIDPTIEIYSNPGALSQVLSNFIMNSLIHAFDKDQDGEIRINGFFDNDKLVIIYKDNGKGMSQEVIDKIYEPFFTTNRANGGSGLGMNIVYTLVTAKLKGSITIHSKPGEGAEFIIKIPVVKK